MKQQSVEPTDAPLTDKEELSLYGIDKKRGFLPGQDPLLALPGTYYSAWEEIVNNLPDLLMPGDFRAVISRLPLLDTRQLRTAAERERAFLLLSLIANAYVLGAGRSEVVPALPRNVAIPFCQIADQVERPPIFSYPTIFHNWRLRDPMKDISFDNLVCLHTFTRNPSEDQFWRVLLEMEYIFSPSLVHIVALRKAMISDECDIVKIELMNLIQICETLRTYILKMPSLCDIHGWIYGLVPYLSGWNEFSSHELLKDGLIYEGVSDEKRKCNSATAAQSAIFMLLDALLAVEHGRKTRPFFDYMGASLHPRHRRLINAILQGPCLRKYVMENSLCNPGLVDIYSKLAYAIIELRHTHFIIANEYLQKKFLDEKQQVFLSQSIGETRSILVPLIKLRRQQLKAVEPATIDPAPMATESKIRRWTVVYASQTGAASVRATDLGALLRQRALSDVAVRVMGMDEYDISREIEAETALLVVTSTFGNGQPPIMGESFRDQLKRLAETGAKYPVQYAVFGLGSSLYPNFCKFAKEVDQWLSQLGGKQLIAFMANDALSSQGNEYEAWKIRLVDSLLNDGKSSIAAVRQNSHNADDQAGPDYSKSNIFSIPLEVPVKKFDVDINKPNRLVAILGNADGPDESVLRHLFASQEYRIRVVAQKPNLAKLRAILPPGCEVVKGDINDVDSLTRGFAGAHAVFAATDFFAVGEKIEVAQGQHVVDAALAAGVKHFLWSSMDDCEVPCFRSKALVARYASEKNLPMTELLPANLFNSFTAIYAPRRARDGTMVFFLPPGEPDIYHYYVSPDDLGGWVLACLNDPERYIGKSVHMCSERLRLSDVAALFTATTGEKSRAEPLTIERVMHTQAFGPLTKLFCVMWEYLRANQTGWRDPAASLAIYPQATKLQEWFAKNGSSIGSRFCGPYA